MSGHIWLNALHIADAVPPELKMMSLLTYCALQRDLNRSSMKERVDLVKKFVMRSLVGLAIFSLTVMLFDILMFWFKWVR